MQTQGACLLISLCISNMHQSKMHLQTNVIVYTLEHMPLRQLLDETRQTLDTKHDPYQCGHWEAGCLVNPARRAVWLRCLSMLGTGSSGRHAGMQVFCCRVLLHLLILVKERVCCRVYVHVADVSRLCGCNGWLLYQVSLRKQRWLCFVVRFFCFERRPWGRE